jgi:hypothetical protein
VPYIKRHDNACDLYNLPVDFKSSLDYHARHNVNAVSTAVILYSLGENDGNKVCMCSVQIIFLNVCDPQLAESMMWNPCIQRADCI